MKTFWTMLNGLLVLVMSGCAPFSKIDVLNPKALQAKEQFSLIKLSTILMLFVILVVVVLFVVFVYKYRKRPGYTPDPQQESGNRKLELTWTISPFIILFILAVPMIKTTFGEEQQSEKKPDLKVVVTANQYWWKFAYPDQGVVTAQELHLPRGKRVQLELHAKDVIHSFWVPQLGGKQDLIPGKTNTLAITPTENGTYEGKCAELCGPGHAYMRFKVKVESEQDFQQWLKGLKGGGIKRQSITQQEDKGKSLFQNSCLSCHAVDATDQKDKEGPNLAGFASRDRVAGVLTNTKDHVQQWVKDPSKVKPGTEMPKFDNMSQADLEAIAAYLQSLK